MILGLAIAGLAAGIIGILVDGRNAVVITVLASSLALSMTAALVAGIVPAALLLLLASAAGIGDRLVRLLARRWAHGSGLDPTTPIFSPPHGLFGPRSVRSICAACAIPVASWINYSVAVGQTTVTQGALFAPAYIWLCGICRFLSARTLEDLAVAIVLIVEATVTASLFLEREDQIAFLIAGVAIPCVAMVAAWMSGRYLKASSS